MKQINTQKSLNEKKDTAGKATAVLGGAGKVLWKIGSWTLNIVLTVLLVGIVTGAIMAGAFAMYIKSYIDPTFDIDDLKLNSNLTTSIYYRETGEDGTENWVELESDRLSGTENRIWVSYDAIPKDMINAIISIEDKRFYSHQGVDIRRTTGAVLGFISGNDSYGGSTITQQLIKQVTGEDDVRIQRKIQEMMRALDLETKRDKSEILEMYLNTIYLSQGCYGIQTAANSYFGKDISECSLVECAALAAIPQAPTKWDPRQNPDKNKKRRNDIINEMYEQGMISIQERDEAWNTELVLADSGEENRTSKVHSYYVDTVIDDVVADLQEELGVSKTVANQMVFSGGLKIYIAQDMKIQKILDECYKDESIFPKVTSGVLPESAMVIIDQYTGDVVALVGGRGEKTTPRGFNRATHAKRQPGSSIKPLSAYSLALEQGLISYATPLDDSPINIGEGEEARTWPSNYPDKYNGLVPANQAVFQSKNTCAVRLIDELSSRYVYDYVTSNYGISTLVDGVTTASGTVLSDVDLAPLALGGMTYGVTVRDMTGAYTAFANNGIYNESRTYLKVLDSEGNVILSNDNNSTVLLKESTAVIMTKMLQDVVTQGTANKASVTLDKYIPVAAKTGTTTETKDLYFVGYTPYYTAAVWCGYDQPKTLRFSTEASMSIWNVVMTRVHQEYIDIKKAGGEVKQFPESSRVVEVEVCQDSGLLPCSYCSLDLRGKRTVKSYFDRDNVPTAICDRHVPVRYCTKSKCLAGDGCPEEDIQIVSLVKLRREFIKQVEVEDAQFTYVDVPADYVYPADRSQPFYINMYPVGLYAGTSGTQTPANGFCVEHNYGLTDAVLPWTRPAAQAPQKK
ncbi:MAG: PBP1A family penicillin-binding protein [Clostridia bacterium]|nr:PBP1A family penicillin-binding protein [Clostridia bacterium]